MDLGQVESAWTAADSLDPAGAAPRHVRPLGQVPGGAHAGHDADPQSVRPRLFRGHLVEEPLGTMTLVVNRAWLYEIRSVGDGL